MNSFPILIGSRAAKLRGVNIVPRDFDIVSDKCESFDADIKYVNETTVYNLLHSTCNDSYRCENNPLNIWLKTITINNEDIKCLIPPLEFIYAFKKSHIHRILKLKDDHDSNIDSWHRSMNHYNLIQLYLGRDRMNKIIYGTLDPIKPLSLERLHDESLIDYYTRTIFLTNFISVNQRFEDANFDIETPNTDYFNDNIKRIIDHDELHKIIDGELSFNNFKKNRNDGSMDPYLFFSAPKDSQLRIIINEIKVLFVERYLIPNIIDENINSNCLYHNFKNIASKFATNLTGKGHSWLRVFVLDNYHIIGDPTIYDFKTLIRIADEIKS